MKIVADINSQTIKLGDLVRQVLCGDVNRREPKRVEATGAARREIVLARSLQWQAAGQFET